LGPYGQALFPGILADTTSQQELDTIKAILEANRYKFFNLALEEDKLDAFLSINNYHAGYA
jgi:amidase